MKISFHAKQRLKERFNFSDNDISEILYNITNSKQIIFLKSYIYSYKRKKAKGQGKEIRELVEINYKNIKIRAILNKHCILTFIFPQCYKGTNFISYQ